MLSNNAKERNLGGWEVEGIIFSSFESTLQWNCLIEWIRFETDKAKVYWALRVLKA